MAASVVFLEEEVVEECKAILLGVSLRVNNPDEWKWLPNQEDGYTVRRVYPPVAHSSRGSYLGCGFGECLAQTSFVEGVYLCMRLLRNRLPTMDNLV